VAAGVAVCGDADAMGRDITEPLPKIDGFLRRGPNEHAEWHLGHRACEEAC